MTHSSKVQMLTELSDTLGYYEEECTETIERIRGYKNVLDIPNWDAINMRHQELKRIYASTKEYVDGVLDAEITALVGSEEPESSEADDMEAVVQKAADSIRQQLHQAIKDGAKQRHIGVELDFRAITLH